MSVTYQCQRCQHEFTVADKDLEFYRKIKVPSPKWCPQCRMQKKLAFWPFGKFHLRECDLDGSKIVSILSKKTRFPVYKASNWFSDKWEAPQIEFSPQKDFFEQFRDLQERTPHPHQLGIKNVNCDYSDDVWYSKNCYLCRSLAKCEDVLYGYRIVECRNSLDITYCYNTENSYDCTYCFDVNKVKYAFDVRHSFDSAFLFDCRNVNNCFMCWNLRNKSYCILNKQYSPEEYRRKLKEYDLGDAQVVETLRKKFWELVAKEAIGRAHYNVKTVNSEGNYLTECKNCRETYLSETSEDCCYVFRGLQNKDSYDSVGLFNCELCAHSVQLTDCYDVKYSIFSTNCRYSEYLDSCVDCEYCFGCVGLKKKKYHFLNKEYSPDEYFELVKKVKKELAKYEKNNYFWPLNLAFVGYNLSLGGIYFPQDKEGVEEEGGFWEELEETKIGARSVAARPDNIKEVSDDILKQALVCQKSSRPFGIHPKELDFYRKNNIPLPAYYPDERTKERILRMGNFQPRQANCCFCNKRINVTFSPNLNLENVACDQCYLQKVV